MTEMLKNKLVPAEKLDEYHETLHQESQRLGHLVENVLAFARLTRGQQRGRADKGTCPQLINRALENLNPQKNSFDVIGCFDVLRSCCLRGQQIRPWK